MRRTVGRWQTSSCASTQRCAESYWFSQPIRCLGGLIGCRALWLSWPPSHLLPPVPPPDIRGSRGKIATRRALLALRDAMSADEHAEASAAICDAANAVLAARLSAGDAVALYAPKGSEVDTGAIDALARA